MTFLLFTLSFFQWHANTQVKVYFMPGFTVEQRGAALRGANSWQVAGITFTESGDTTAIQKCENCLTFERKPSEVKGELAHLRGWPYIGTQWLCCAVIDLDPKTLSDAAVESFTAHEIGHSLGLGHRPKSIMGTFDHGLNRAGPYLGPTSDDQVLASANYAEEKHAHVQTKPLVSTKLNPEASKAWLEIEAAKSKVAEQYRILESQQAAIAIGAGVPAADRLHPTQDKDGLIIFVHQEPQPQKEKP